MVRHALFGHEQFNQVYYNQYGDDLNISLFEDVSLRALLIMYFIGYIIFNEYNNVRYSYYLNILRNTQHSYRLQIDTEALFE